MYTCVHDVHTTVFYRCAPVLRCARTVDTRETRLASVAGINVHGADDKIKIVLFSSFSVARGINVGVTHAAIDLVANPLCHDDREGRNGRAFLNAPPRWKFGGTEVDGARDESVGASCILLCWMNCSLCGQ